MTTGSLGTPLTRKLGIGPGDRVGTFGAPRDLSDVLGPLPDGASLVRWPRAACRVHLVFATDADQLERRFARAVALLPADGALWVAWPKRASGIESDVDFDLVQSHGLESGLVDNKVAAIDDTWSGLRFVVRTADRADWPDS
jgi:hypothetical protein